MSFEIVCHSCGAVSGPSVGICPYCKSVLCDSTTATHEQESSIAQLYQQGKMDRALLLARKIYNSDHDAKKNVSFLLLFCKILIDTEGPSSQIKGLLAEAHLIEPANQEVLEFLELSEAIQKLRKGLNDQGEIQIKGILRRSPQNVQALFQLGAHLFWTDSEPTLAIPYLESCVRLAPNFLRAWGCLGTIYKKLGHNSLASLAFRRCAELETNLQMKSYFIEQSEQ